MMVETLKRTEITTEGSGSLKVSLFMNNSATKQPYEVTKSTNNAEYKTYKFKQYKKAVKKYNKCLKEGK